MPPVVFRHRIATNADKPDIIALMSAAIEHNMRAFLSPAEIEAARATMGIDQTLIDDGTYFLIETLVADQPVLVGCGGWGKRRTLYGGNHTVGRDDRLSDPKSEPARIRAMYTHPDWVRRGIGSLLLDLGEAAAKKAGFLTIELGSTLAGEPLYLSRGYKAIRRDEQVSDSGAVNVVIHMSKPL